MQDWIGESFRLVWIESFEFGHEFEEVWRDWSTKIAPLWTLIINLEQLDIPFQLPLLAEPSTNIINNNNNLCQDPFTESFDSRTDYQTSQHVIYNESCVKSRASWTL